MNALKSVFMAMVAFGVIIGMVLLVTGLLYHTDAGDKTSAEPIDYGRISQGVSGDPRATEVYMMQDGSMVYVYKDENGNPIT